MPGGEDRAELGPLFQSYQHDVENEGDQNEDHDLAKRPAKNLFHTCGHSILTKIRVDHHCVQVEAVFQTHQHRAEVADQTTRTNDQDKVPDNCFNRASQDVIPGLLQQDITEQNDQTNKVGGLGNNVIDDKFPDCV